MDQSPNIKSTVIGNQQENQHEDDHDKEFALLFAKPLLQDLESKVNSQLTDVQLMLSQSDLLTQRHFKKTKELAMELETLKESLQIGALAPTIERMVQDFLDKEREKEPEARNTGHSSHGSGSAYLKEFAVFTDEIKLMQTHIKELQRSSRQLTYENDELRGYLNLLGQKVEEKPSRAYVDLKFDSCIQKEAIFEMKEQLAEQERQAFESEKLSANLLNLHLQKGRMRNEDAYTKEEVDQLIERHAQALKDDIEDSFTKLNQNISQVSQDLNQINARLGNLSQEQNSMGNQIQRKADVSEIRRINDEFKLYSKYADLKSLYQKVVPVVSAFETKIIEFGKDSEQCKLMISRMDEVLSDKASKSLLESFRASLTELVSKDMLERFEHQQDSKRHELRCEIADVRAKSIMNTEVITRELASIVRRQTNQVRNELVYHLQKQGLVQDHQLPALLVTQQPAQNEAKLKSSLDQIDQNLEKKANRVDMVHTSRNIDVLHSQIQHILIILTEFIKLLGLGPQDLEKLQSEKLWFQRREFMTQQLGRLTRWVFKFNPNENAVIMEEDQMMRQSEIIREKGSANMMDITRYISGDHQSQQKHPQKKDTTISIVQDSLYEQDPNHKSMTAGSSPSTRISTTAGILKGGIPAHIRARLSLDKKGAGGTAAFNQVRGSTQSSIDQVSTIDEIGSGSRLQQLQSTRQRKRNVKPLSINTSQNFQTNVLSQGFAGESCNIAVTKESTNQSPLFFSGPNSGGETQRLFNYNKTNHFGVGGEGTFPGLQPLTGISKHMSTFDTSMQRSLEDLRDGQYNHLTTNYLLQDIDRSQRINSPPSILGGQIREEILLSPPPLMLGSTDTPNSSMVFSMKALPGSQVQAKRTAKANVGLKKSVIKL